MTAGPKRLPKYSGWDIHYYRGAINAALRECAQIEAALGVTDLRMRTRLEQMEMLVAGVEKQDLEDQS